MKKFLIIPVFIFSFLLITAGLHADTLVLNNFGGAGDNFLQSGNYGESFAAGDFNIDNKHLHVDVPSISGSSGAYWNSFGKLDLSKYDMLSVDVRTLARNISGKFSILFGRNGGAFVTYNFSLPQIGANGGRFVKLSISLKSPSEGSSALLSNVTEYQIKSDGKMLVADFDNIAVSSSPASLSLR